MALASLPVWMEFVINDKYPTWRKVEHNPDGTARYMPAGVRLVEKSLQREFRPEDIVVCYPDDLDKFLGPRTRAVGVSTHNPLGVTFAAGVYTSMFGSSKEPINSHYAKLMFAKIKANPFRQNFKVIVGGSGGWQIIQTNSFEDLSVDCVVEGRSESADAVNLFHKAIRGEALPREVNVVHPTDREAILVPEKRTTFGVIEMTTGLRAALPVLRARPESPNRRAQRQDHGGGARQRPRGQQPDFPGHGGHVHLGPGAHRNAVLLPQSRGAGVTLHRHRRTRPA